MIEITKSSARIPVLALGNGWIVLDKPVSMSVHNNPGTDLLSLTGAWLKKKPRLAEKIGFATKLHAVHRLDKDTSGVILLVTQSDLVQFFSEQFSTRQAIKTYIAVVHGRPDSKETFNGDTPIWNEWSYPLAKQAGGRRNPAGVGKKFECTTRFQILETSRHYSLLKIRPVTGRKHQIRRHAKIAGHPVVGDRRYGSPRSIQYLKNRCSYFRLGLHCFSLSLIFPDTTAFRKIKTTDIPNAMLRLLESDR